MKRARYATAIAALLASAGLQGCTTACGRPHAGTPLVLPEADRHQAFEAAMAVLGRMHFRIDKADPNAGLIQTQPLPAAQWFEFWRSDNVTLCNHAEANLHSLRRTVRITLLSQAQGLSLDCQVNVQRLSVPSRTVSSSVTAYQTLSESTVYAQSLKLSPEQEKAMEWVDQGSDTGLASRVLRRKQTALRGPRNET